MVTSDRADAENKKKAKASPVVPPAAPVALVTVGGQSPPQTDGERTPALGSLESWSTVNGKPEPRPSVAEGRVFARTRARTRPAVATACLGTLGGTTVEAPTYIGATTAVVTGSGAVTSTTAAEAGEGQCRMAQSQGAASPNLGISMHRPPQLHLAVAPHTALNDGERDVDGAPPLPPSRTPIVSDSAPDNSSFNTRQRQPLQGSLSPRQAPAAMVLRRRWQSTRLKKVSRGCQPLMKTALWGRKDHSCSRRQLQKPHRCRSYCSFTPSASSVD